jgi:hypothetical protein
MGMVNLFLDLRFAIDIVQPLPKHLGIVEVTLGAGFFSGCPNQEMG